MTPSFIGLIATMLPGVRPSMSFASFPTASILPLTLLIATIDGSLTTVPFPRASTQVLEVPRSIARQLENHEKRERRRTDESLSARGHANAVLSAVLDPVHRLIGRLDETLGSRGHVRQRRHADRRGERDAQAVPLQKSMCRKPFPDALADIN